MKKRKCAVKPKDLLVHHLSRWCVSLPNTCVATFRLLNPLLCKEFIFQTLNFKVEWNDLIILYVSSIILISLTIYLKFINTCNVIQYFDISYFTCKYEKYQYLTLTFNLFFYMFQISIFSSITIFIPCVVACSRKVSYIHIFRRRLFVCINPCRITLDVVKTIGARQTPHIHLPYTDSSVVVHPWLGLSLQLTWE